MKPDAVVSIDGNTYGMFYVTCPCCERRWWTFGPRVCLRCWPKGHEHAASQ